MAFWLVVLLVAVLLWCLHTCLGESGRLIAKIPGPKDYPIIGNALLVVVPRDKLFTFLRSLYKNFGTVVKLYGLDRRTINIYEPDDVEKILTSMKFIDKSIPYTFLKPWLADGLLTVSRSRWHQRRKMIAPLFYYSCLKKHMQTFAEETEELLTTVDKEVEKDKTDFYSLITNTTLNIILKTAMGVSMSQFEIPVMKSYVEAIENIGACMLTRMCTIWYHLGIIFKFSATSREQTETVKILHNFTNQIIRERKAYLENNKVNELKDDGCDDDDEVSKKKRLCMLDVLLQYEKENKMDINGVRQEVDTIMFGGHDTSATALNFMILRIAHEPEAQEKMYNELQTIFGDSQRQPTMEDLQRMNYLKYCILELMRIYPPVPFIARVVSEEVTLSGYRVPAGSAISIHIYDIHHRSDLYPEPEKFIPERFLPENCLKRHPYAYLPFSAGLRNCIGQKFAMLQLKVMLSGLLRRFKVEPVTKLEDLTYTTAMMLRTTEPIYVKFCKRS